MLAPQEAEELFRTLRDMTTRGESVVFADDGARQSGGSAELAGRAASAWVGQPLSAAAITTLTDADQWTVQSSFRSQRPLSKYAWPNGEQVYVSQASGEVVQYTTSASRLGACGRAARV